MIFRHALQLSLAGLTLASASLFAAEPVNIDPGFESDVETWGAPFIPGDSKNRGCELKFTSKDPHSGKRCAVMYSDTDSRFAITPPGGAFVVYPSEEYEISIWVKADHDFVIKDGTPGFVLRVDMLEGKANDETIFINWEGQTANKPQEVTSPIPQEWTEIKAKVKVPATTNRMRVNLFYWRASGTLLLDDLEIKLTGNP